MKSASRRLIVLNNYSLERVSREVADGKKPAHHLFGIDHLQRRGWEIFLAPCDEKAEPAAPLRRMIGKMGGVLQAGHLAQQRLAWRMRHHYPILYAPCQTQVGLLAMIRRVSRSAPRLAVLSHHPVLGGRFGKFRQFVASLVWRGVDVPLALSMRVAEEIAKLRGERGFPIRPCWGPEMGYYRQFHRPASGGVASAGRTGRDFGLLADAARCERVRVEIICLEREAQGLEERGGGLVQVVAARDETDLDYSKLLPLLAERSVHAIPLIPGRFLSGLTSLCDAIALGRAVIMTRNPFIDVDIEAEGFGIWVEPGDLAGWRRALRWVADHPLEVTQMGRQALRFASEQMNYQRFCEQIESVMEGLARQAL